MIPAAVSGIGVGAASIFQGAKRKTGWFDCCLGGERHKCRF